MSFNVICQRLQLNPSVVKIQFARTHAIDWPHPKGGKHQMAIGLGGVFLRAQNPDALYNWYEQHLGLKRTPGGILFPEGTTVGPLVLSFFSEKSAYFPHTQRAMLNLQMEDVDALLDRLIASGVEVDPKRESSEYGRFGWFTDLEGNRVEVWQATKGE